MSPTINQLATWYSDILSQNQALGQQTDCNYMSDLDTGVAFVWIIIRYH